MSASIKAVTSSWIDLVYHYSAELNPLEAVLVQPSQAKTNHEHIVVVVVSACYLQIIFGIRACSELLSSGLRSPDQNLFVNQDRQETGEGASFYSPG